MRNSNTKHIQQQLSEKSLTLAQGSYELLSIQEQRVKGGVLQYLVEWKGYEKMSWMDADQLNAPEILEDWEIQNLLDEEENYNVGNEEGIPKNLPMNISVNRAGDELLNINKLKGKRKLIAISLIRLGYKEGQV